MVHTDTVSLTTRARRPALRRRALTPARRTVLLFVGPGLLLYGILFLYPVLSALTNSLFTWAGTTRLDFVAFENFITVFGLEPYASQFVTALGNNAFFFVGTMVLQNGTGLLLAFALNRTLPGKRLFQTIISVPYLMSALVIGYAWSMLLSPHFGVVNAMLEALGVEGKAWLGEPALIMPIIILINSWQWCGVPMLIFGAALAGIPNEQIEAARVDGANAVRIAVSVQMPHLIPATSIITVLTLIGTVNLFDLVYAIGGTSGGVGGAADVLGTLFYRVSFSNSPNAAGLSGALSVVQFVLIVVLAVLVQRVFARLGRRFS